MTLPPGIIPTEIHVPGTIHFAPGAVDRVGEAAAPLGTRAFLVTGGCSLKQGGVLDRITGRLAVAGVTWILHPVKGEPDVAAVDAAVRSARAGGCDLVIAAGGGSALDLGKAVAGMLANDGSILEYLEGAGPVRAMARDPAPCIAVPTTAGTGSEATKNAVITADTPVGRAKRSFRDVRLVSRVAIVDPDLMVSCPPAVTAACGMDAVCQLVESLTSLNATAVTDGLAVLGLEAAGRSLGRAVRHGDDLAARTDLAYAALLSGITLSHAGLGAVHGLASPLGAAIPVPHGHACAVLLPRVTRANLAALGGGRGEARTVAAYDRAAAALGETVEAFCARFEFAGLASFGLTEAAIPAIVAGATSGSVRTNPVTLTPPELEEILRRAR